MYNGSESEVGKIGLAIQREFENMMKIYEFNKFSEENAVNNEPIIMEEGGKNKMETPFI